MDDGPNLEWVRRELGSIESDLRKAISRFEPPTAREVMSELARIVSVLQSLYPEEDE